jgi:hypothetical protein
MMMALVMAFEGFPGALAHSSAVGDTVWPVAGHMIDLSMGLDRHLVFTAGNAGRFVASQPDLLAFPSKLLLHYASKGADRQAAISA